MKPTTGLALPASFVVTVSHAGAEVLPTAPVENDILTVADAHRTTHGHAANGI
jgi:hypothetical protein